MTVRPIALGTAVIALAFGGLTAMPAYASSTNVADWTSLETAFQSVAAGSSDTIVLDADISESGVYLGGANIGTPGPVGGSGGANITLDLNGHALDITAPSGHAAIEVFQGTSLTITDSGNGGTLNATATQGGSGIGVSEAQPYYRLGNITITGGAITATAQDTGAGIGAYTLNHLGGTVQVDGGVVSGTGSNGPGIGGSNILRINGGDVTGVGGADFPGVGASQQTLAVNGGSVDATGGSRAAGLGGAYNWTNLLGITIDGATISATGGAGGAGIGTGQHGSIQNGIQIANSDIDATGGAGGAGIGGGVQGDYFTVNVESGAHHVYATGTVLASTTTGGAGIGGGANGPVGLISVTGTVDATGGGAAGIGSGAGAGAGEIHLFGGNITATGTFGSAGIGGSYGNTAGSVSIMFCPTVHAIGASDALFGGGASVGTGADVPVGTTAPAMTVLGSAQTGSATVSGAGAASGTHTGGLASTLTYSGGSDAYFATATDGAAAGDGGELTLRCGAAPSGPQSTLT
ncbi:MAG: hypothetical protein ACKOXM_03335, partial [Agromyces sp.]